MKKHKVADTQEARDYVKSLYMSSYYKQLPDGAHQLTSTYQLSVAFFNMGAISRSEMINRF
jgi:hypothetical protein